MNSDTIIKIMCQLFFVCLIEDFCCNLINNKFKKIKEKLLMKMKFFLLFRTRGGKRKKKKKKKGKKTSFLCALKGKKRRKKRKILNFLSFFRFL